VLTISGLVMNVIGSLLFIIDSNRLQNTLSSMVEQIAEGHGRFDGKSFTTDQLKHLANNIRKSKSFTIVGYTLFIAGFALQLIAAICSS